MLVYLFLSLCAFVHAQAPVVNTTQGLVEGQNAADGNYYTFYGIHYGGAMIGENRFKPPLPPPTYPGTYHAIDYNVICAQPTSRGLIGQEDCLVLNIFTKDLTSSNPVLVWLIGEEYTNVDSTVRSFRRLVEENVVVVQINYRLSIFGFLCLRVAEAPGNAGLKDVVQGLKWIKDNIARFGGDPNNVAIFGHGSGAAMADLITLSPMAKDLVHKAIIQSGSAIAPWAVAFEPIKYAENFAAELAYTGKTRQELAMLLRSTDLNVLSAALVSQRPFFNNSILFAPCIEDPNLNPNDTFLAQAPFDLLRLGNYSQIPYIAGFTDMEGSMRAEQAIRDGWLEAMQANFTNFLPVDLDLKGNMDLVKNITQFYFGNKSISMETIMDYMNYQGDTLIRYSVIRGTKERARTSTAQVRLYEFTYRGTQNSDWVFPQIPLMGVPHGTILKFILDYDLREPLDDSARKAIVSRVVSFVNNTLGSSVEASRAVEWPAIRSGILYYLHMSGGAGQPPETSTFGEGTGIDPHSQIMSFWNDTYAEHYRVPQFNSAWKFGVGVLLLFSQLLLLW